MGIQNHECIGCGSCVTACKTENNVPEEPFYFRTWVERYVVKNDNSVIVHSIDGGSGEIYENIKEKANRWKSECEKLINWKDGFSMNSIAMSLSNNCIYCKECWQKMKKRTLLNV